MTAQTAQTTMIRTMTMMIMMMDGGVRQIERIECSLLPTFCTVWPDMLLVMIIMMIINVILVIMMMMTIKIKVQL